MPTRTVLVTGAASGIGRRLTAVLLELGDRVYACDLDVGALGRAALEDGWDPDRGLLRGLDVRDGAAWGRLVAESAAPTGLDILFNVAGYLRPGRVHEVTSEDIDRHVDVNLKGVMYGTQAAAAQMVRQGRGHVVNIASMAALAPVPGLTLYSATKYAVRAFSLASATDLAGTGVAVTVACPDAVQTPMLDSQRGSRDAALTFSGPKVLTVDEVVDELVGHVLTDRPLEVALPRSRAVLARLANTFPAAVQWLDPILRRKGMRQQEFKK